MKIKTLSILAISLLMICALNSVAYSQATDKEKETFINSLSGQQLYNLFADTSMNEIKSQEGANFSEEQLNGIRQCILGSVTKNFTEQEMRDLFLQPAGMDTEYFQGKFEVAGNEITTCSDAIFNK